MFQKLIMISAGIAQTVLLSQRGPGTPTSSSAELTIPLGWKSQIRMIAVATPLVTAGR